MTIDIRFSSQRDREWVHQIGGKSKEMGVKYCDYDAPVSLSVRPNIESS